MTGGAGGDTFRFEGMVNAKDEIVAKHTVSMTAPSTGWRHRREQRRSRSPGGRFRQRRDPRLQPLPGRQDRNLGAHRRGHSRSSTSDNNGDGKNDYSVITVISQQGNAGAHDEDLLGTITVYGNLVKAERHHSRPRPCTAPTRRSTELNGASTSNWKMTACWPGGGTDGGHHNEATAMANMHM